jgi:ATP-dependent DNA helicase 2 subunit 2
VTMFLVDVSPSMAKTREVEAETSDGSIEVVTMTNLQWALQFVKLKIQDMVSLSCLYQ